MPPICRLRRSVAFFSWTAKKRKMTSVTMQGPLEQTVAKCNWIFVQIRISNELNKLALKCKADQTAEFVRPKKIKSLST